MKTINLSTSIIVIILFFTSCKKEMAIEEIKNNQSQITTIKDWYNTHKPLQFNMFSRDSADTPTMPTADPEWDSTHTYAQSQLTSFVVPMRFDKENSHANQFIILQVNENNEVIKSEYAFILLDSTATNNYTKQSLETLSPDVFDFNNIPVNLKGWVIKFDFNSSPIAAKYISDATTTDKELQFGPFLYNKAPKPECIYPVCLDWFIDTYVNGELVSSEYIGTTCSCYGGYSGGGGGGGGVITVSNSGSEESEDRTMNVKNDGHCEIFAEYTFTGYKFPASNDNYFNAVCPKSGQELPYFANINTAGNPSDPWHSKWTPLENIGDVNTPNTSAFTKVIGRLNYPNNPQLNGVVNKVQSWQASDVFQ